MSDYYRHARTITRAREQIISRATPRVGPQAPARRGSRRGLRIFDGQVTIADANELATDPALALAALRGRDRALDAGAALSRATRSRGSRAIPRSARRCAPAPRRPRSSLSSICDRARDAPAAGLGARRAARRGPAAGDDPRVFAGGRPRAPRPLPRVHGRRSLGGRGRSAARARARRARRTSTRSRAASPPRSTRPAVLFFATLLHDVGKAIGGKDHSRARRRDGARHPGAPRPARPRTSTRRCHLILQHLVMYHVATRRDLDDPATVARVRARGARPRGAARSLPAHRGRSLDHQPDLDDLVEGADARRAVPRHRRAARRASRSTKGASSRKVREQVPQATWKRRRVDSASSTRFMASMPERYLLANSPRRDRRARASSRDARGRPTGHRAAWSRRATPRPPSCASSPPTAPASSPPSPPRSRPAASRCTPRRSTRARCPTARSRRSTSSGCAIASTARRASRPRHAEARARLACGASRRGHAARSRAPGRGATSPWAERPAPRSAPRSRSTTAPRPATR